MKRGFTLVELVAVIIILGLIILIVIPIFTQSLEDSQKKLAQTQEKEVIAAAQKWQIAFVDEFFVVSENELVPVDCYIISLEQLKSDGYLSKGNTVDPISDTNYNLTHIKLVYQESTKQYTYTWEKTKATTGSCS